MKFRVNAAAAAILAASLVVSYAQTSGTTPPVKKHTTTTKEKMPPPPSVADQINALRQEMQSQIDALKSSLADKDAQLRQAQQTATDAQAKADKAEADAMAQQQAYTENTAAVTTLQSTVKDLQGNETSLATTVSDETTNIKKAINSPDALHYKGITLSPAGSFLAAETVWRNAATGGDINTALDRRSAAVFRCLPAERVLRTAVSRALAIKATGKLDNMTLTGYYELDWLSAGITSNNNQSNSYTMRQRQLWADAKTDQRLGLLRRHGLVAGGGNHAGPDARNGDPAGHHRRAVRGGLRVDPPVQLPREQEHRQEGLLGRLD